MKNKNWMTEDEAAVYLRIDVKTLRSLNIPHVKLGDYAVYDRERLTIWMQEQLDGAGTGGEDSGDGCGKLGSDALSSWIMGALNRLNGAERPKADGDDTGERGIYLGESIIKTILESMARDRDKDKDKDKDKDGNMDMNQGNPLNARTHPTILKGCMSPLQCRECVNIGCPVRVAPMSGEAAYKFVTRREWSERGW